MNSSDEKPAPTDEDVFIWNRSGQLAIEISKAIVDRPGGGPQTRRVVSLFNQRIAGGMNSLWVLRRNAPHDYGMDGMMVLRGIYDTHLQALFVLEGGGRSDNRANEYLDFQWVEHRRMKDLLDSNPSRMAQRIRNSPMRAAAEPGQDAAYDRVADTYRGPKARLRKTWYPGSLYDLARVHGSDIEGEYRMMQPLLSSAVHSSPHRLLSGPVLSDDAILMMGWQFTFRVLGKFADHQGVRLESRHKDLTQPSYLSCFDGPWWDQHPA